jgi:hypothetical protein
MLLLVMSDLHQPGLPLEVSVLHEPVLQPVCLAVSVLQQPVLPLDISVTYCHLQQPMLPLDLSAWSTAAYAAIGHVCSTAAWGAYRRVCPTTACCL